MPEAAASRLVHVSAPDDMLVRALNQHAAGWRAVPLAGIPEPDGLAIVDLAGPDEAQAAAHALRADGFAGPILVLGEREAASAGDAEILTRPVRLGALLARIEAHWIAAGEADLILLGPYEFVPAEQLLRDPGTDAVIRLTELERKLLLYLAAANGAAVEREQLLADVWGYSAGVDTHTVETHIWRLRQKIETEDPASRFLITEAGSYRLLLAGEEPPG